MNNTNYTDNIRSKCISILMKELKNEQKCRQIEQNIYNSTIQYAISKNFNRNWENKHFKNIYFARIRSFYTNIKSSSYLHNIEFKNNIENGTIDCSTISSLTPYDIFPENWKDLIDCKMRKDKLKYELKPEAMTDMFKCNKCHGRSCTYYEIQTRSADEPMTQFITCLTCNNNWKQ